MTGVLMLAGMCGLCVGAYGLLDGSTPGAAAAARASLGGAALCCAGLALGRPPGSAQPLPTRPLAASRSGSWPLSGVIPPVVLSPVSASPPPASTRRPIRSPGRRFPLVPALAILVAAIAAVAAPPSDPPGQPAQPTVTSTAAPTGADRSTSRLRRRHRRGPGMIAFDHVSITYADADAPVLRDVNLRIDEGELALVVGRTGVGKSTLLGAINGLVPHFTGGTLAGRVLVDGRDTRTHKPRELADVVGVVGQDPSAGFVTDTVEEELAYGMEQLAVPPDVMRKRVEETLDLLGIAELRDRPLHRALRWPAAASRHRLGADRPPPDPGPGRADVCPRPDRGRGGAGRHHPAGPRPRRHRRPGRAPPRAGGPVRRPDRRGATPTALSPTASPAAMLATTEVAPPVVELGRLAGWQPLPLSVRDARRQAGPLRERDRRPRLVPPDSAPWQRRVGAIASASPQRRRPLRTSRRRPRRRPRPHERARSPPSWAATAPGKSSLLWALQGSGPRQAGTVDVGGSRPQSAVRRPKPAPWSAWSRRPQPTSSTSTPWPRNAPRPTARPDGASPVPARTLLDRLAPGIADDIHPRDLSEGQRLSLVLAVQLAAAPKVVLLDEPTRGLDYRGQRS